MSALGLRISGPTFLRSSLIGLRGFHATSCQLAKAGTPKSQLGGKKKAKQGFKTKKDSNEGKVKKGGMTHLKFRDAVRSLGLEKNAPPVGVKDMSYETLFTNKGEIVKYSKSVEDKLNLLGSFKKYQHHELFSNPISIISDNLLQLTELFLNKFDTQSTDKNRQILMGHYRVGKSTLISQIKALGLLKYNNDLVLLHFDHPENLINGTSDYIYNKKLEVYQQPMFTKRWIMKIREANKDIFSKLKLSRDISFTTKKVEYNYKAGENTLYEYLSNCYDFGKVESTFAFDFFISELKHHSQKNNIPVLLSVDNFNALTTEPLTRYRHPDFTPIHFQEFEIGKFILDFVSGHEKFDKGGILLSESYDIGKSDNLYMGLGLKEYDPYRSNVLDSNLIERLLSNGGISVFEVQNLNKADTATLIDFYHKVGVLHVRDYIYKQDSDELKTGNVDMEQLTNFNFMKSAGNPGLLLQHVAMSF